MAVEVLRSQARAAGLRIDDEVLRSWAEFDDDAAERLDDLIADHRAAEQVAAAEGVDYDTAVQLVGLDRQIDDVRADCAPQSNPVPHLDTHELAPDEIKPWSDEAWERDQLRGVVHGLEFSRAEWKLYAEQGKDIVWELMREREAQKVEPLKFMRDQVIESAQLAVDAQRRAEREAAKPEPAPPFVRFGE